MTKAKEPGRSDPTTAAAPRSSAASKKSAWIHYLATRRGRQSRAPPRQHPEHPESAGSLGCPPCTQPAPSSSVSARKPCNSPGGQAAAPTAVAPEVFLGGTQGPSKMGEGLPAGRSGPASRPRDNRKGSATAGCQHFTQLALPPPPQPEWGASQRPSLPGQVVFAAAGHSPEHTKPGPGNRRCGPDPRLVHVQARRPGAAEGRARMGRLKPEDPHWRPGTRPARRGPSRRRGPQSQKPSRRGETQRGCADPEVPSVRGSPPPPRPGGARPRPPGSYL